MSSTEPEEFYACGPWTDEPRPEVGWKLAKSHLAYADYLFRRVSGSRYFSGVADVILTGRVEHKLFGEQPSHAMRVTLCAPFLATLNANRASIPVSIRDRERDIIHWLLFGSITSECLCFDDIFKLSFLFGFYPFFFTHSQIMRSDDTFRRHYRENIERYGRALDYSHHLTFRYYAWRWRRFLPSFWEKP